VSVSGRKVKVRILPGHVVYLDGHGYSASETADVPAADAKALIAAGSAEKAK